MSHRRRSTASLMILFIVVTSYNLFKPFHIDDAAHLIIARWIADHPLHPMIGILNWIGLDQPIHVTNQPHLYFYIMALWGMLFGYSEVAMHMLQSISALACILIFAKLTHVFVPKAPLWATAMLVLSPAFVVEQNMMVDVPLLALWLIFFSTLVIPRPGMSQSTRYLIASIFCSAALLVKYSSLVLIPVLLTSLVLERRWKDTWVLLVPLASLMAWSTFNWIDYGGIHIFARPSETSDPDRLQHFIRAWVLTLGGLTPLGIIVVISNTTLLRRYERILYILIIFCFIALCSGVATGVIKDQQSDLILKICFLINGCLIFFAIIPTTFYVLKNCMKGMTHLQDEYKNIIILLWVFGTSLFYIILAPFIAARHVLLIMPAVVIIILERWGAPSRAAIIFGLGSTVLISSGLSLSDWRFAAFHRDEAALLAAQLSGPGQRWASGHWGWQWYGTVNGMREIDVMHSAIHKGDTVVVAADVSHEELNQRNVLSLVRTDRQDKPLLNLLCTMRPSRLYHSSFYDGPWSVSRSCISEIDIFSVF